MSEQIGLVIDGIIFTGWKSASIRRDLAALCGSFSITLADEDNGKNWGLVTQKECVLKIGSDKIMTGVIDSVNFSLDAEGHNVTIQGRDKTSDLVDCSASINSNGEPLLGTWKKVDLLGLASGMLSPFGLQVRKETDIGDKFTRFAIQRGESVFEALDRAAKQRGVVLLTDASGVLVLTMSGTTTSGDLLKYGSSNLKACSGTYDYANRFSHYRVETQASSEGKTSAWESSGNLVGTFLDKSVTRFRPLIISAEADSTRGSCKKRAAFEALYRAASSQIFEVTVAGWRQEDKQLWVQNQLVNVDIPPLYLKEELLITGIGYEFDSDSGSTTTLSLMRKDAFNNARAIEALAIKDPKGTKRNW